MARCRHVIDQRAGAVQRGAFFVTGDDKADRARFDRHIGDGGDHRRNRALHVDRAAPVQQFTAHFGGERIGCPAISRRHHIQMPGKGKVP